MDNHIQTEACNYIQAGFAVLPKVEHEKRSLINNWQTTVLTPDQFIYEAGRTVLVDEVRKGHDGWLIRLGQRLPDGRYTIMLDFDIYDQQLAHSFRQIADDVLGHSYPIRVGRAPKFAIFVPFDEEGQSGKVVYRHSTINSAKDNAIEIRCGNMLAGIAGPFVDDEGNRHEYKFVRGELKDILQLPSITRDQLEQVVTRCGEEAERQGWAIGRTQLGRAARGGTIKPPVIGLTIELAKTALEKLDDYSAEYKVDHDLWLRVGMALHHQFDGSEDALNLWDAWSAEASNYDQKALRKRWTTFHSDTVGAVTMKSFLTLPIVNEWWLAQDVGIDFGWAKDIDRLNSSILNNDALLERVLVQRFAVNREKNTYIDVESDHLGTEVPQTKLDKEWIRPVELDANGRRVRRPTASDILSRSPYATHVRGLAWHPVNAHIIHLNDKPYFNTFRQWDQTGEAGDVRQWLKLCHHVLGEHMDLVLDWMAFSLQNPTTKIMWQVLVHGAPRTGKTLVGKIWARLFGGSGAFIDPENISAGWGDVYYERKAIVFEEVWFPGGKAFFNSLKSKLVNDDIEAINIKGKGICFQRNLYSIYMCSNHDNALMFDADDDKLLVIKGPDERLSDEDYANIGTAIENVDGTYMKAIRHFLMHRDVSQFSYGKLPVRTEAAIAMARASVSDTTDALITMIEEQRGPFRHRAVKFEEIRAELMKDGYRVFNNDIAATLKKMGFIRYEGQRNIEGKRPKHRFLSQENLTHMTATELYDWFETKSEQSKLT